MCQTSLHMSVIHAVVSIGLDSIGNPKKCHMLIFASLHESFQPSTATIQNPTEGHHFIISSEYKL